MNQVLTGHLNESDCLYYTDDGKKWRSTGCIDFGNNNFFEVMVPEVKPVHTPTDFAGDVMYDFPVFMMSHEDGGEILGTPLTDFMTSVALDWGSDHLNEIIIQLGSVLASYK